MNQSKFHRNVIIFIEAFSGFMGLILFLLNWFISVYPDKVREKVGDRAMAWLSGLPLPIIIFILVLIFICFLFYSMWINGAFDKKSKITDKKSVPSKDIQETSNVGAGLQSSKPKNNRVPKGKHIVYQAGLVLDTFEKKFELVKHSKIEDNIEKKFNDAKSEIYKLLDDFLPDIKAILKNSDDIKIALEDLCTSVNLYQAVLEEFIQQEKAPYDSIYMKTGGLEHKIDNAVSLRSNTGKAYSDVMKNVAALRQKLKENL